MEPTTHPSTAPPAASSARGLTKVYGTGAAQVRALDGVDVDFAAGRFTAIMGPSGSGKSTLMHCLAGLDQATSGTVHLGSTEITRLGDDALTRLRRDRVGFVFQSFNLLPMFTAEQNIVLPLDLAGAKVDPAWLATLVQTLGLGQRLTHRPSELSGGQQQRVAIARALVAQPEVVFADEPTGNLDSRSGAEVLSFLRRSVRELGRTIIMVTHDPTAAAYADRVVLLADGRIAGDISDPTPEAVLAGLEGLRALESSADEPVHGGAVRA
ncbi:ABC transporter ATP-binding protein [Cellulomonas oligotrophica]|uniref:ABC transporter ATP-binding protein n=1 Tax=Cellulomonas oligotrophica TaxID=931536 RepID=A0A7Y9JYL7_9CELL|nr:ABC transporter ATP-binding protein [Cellulomonas oligotrophica]NYD85250.1 putative ABC transport system ATP-binding protein [Cellulomonas oligotrophica]GIG33314.1 ABC transporter ATP-binding protein [Cellulomonas oligotrophica]